MTEPRDIRALLGRIQDPALRLAAKIGAVRDAVAVTAAKGQWVERDGLSLSFDRDPEIILNRRGEAVGIDATVRAFRNGTEVRVDPHRVFVNPPILVPNGVSETGERLYREDPAAAYLDVLLESITSTPNPKGWRTRGTVTTVFANSGDGAVSSNNGTYTTLLAGSGLSAATASASEEIGQEHVAGDTLYIGYQLFFGFDTSAIDDAATIDAAVFSLYGSNKFTDKAHTLQARTYDYGASVTTADWRTGGGAGTFQALTLLATFALDATGSQWSTTGYNDFTESGSALRSAVNKTGTTYIVVCNNDFAAGTAPTSSRQRVDCYMADQAGTTNDPKLVVTSTLPPSATGTPSLPGLNASGSAAHSQSATGGPTLPNLLAAAAGTQTITSAGAPSLPGLNAAATGDMLLDGAGAGTLPNLTANGSATQADEATATGSPSLPTLSAAAAGLADFVGTGAPTLPNLLAAASGAQTQSATGSTSLPSASAAGDGAHSQAATGSPALPNLLAAAAGSQTQEATGTPTLPGLLAAAAGTQTITSTGAPSLPGLLAAAAGTQTITAAGGPFLGALVASGAGGIPATAIGAVTFGALVAAGVAVAEPVRGPFNFGTGRAYQPRPGSGRGYRPSPGAGHTYNPNEGAGS